MIRVLTILATIAALAVSAAPASAGSSKKPPPRTPQVVVLIGANDYGLVAKPLPRGAAGVVTNNNDPDKLGKVHAGGARVIEVPSVKYTAVNAMYFPWDMTSKAPPKPRGIAATKDLDCASTPFMDYTDDSCMAKSKGSGLKAGGNEVLYETAKANVRGKAKVPRGGASLSGGIPDGTSNTMMRSGSLKPPNGIIAILIG